MDCLIQWFCEEICRVFDTRDVVNVNDSLVDTGMDKVEADVNMFHLGVRVRVMCASHCTLVVAV
jgi:hypothetical protein